MACHLSDDKRSHEYQNQSHKVHQWCHPAFSREEYAGKQRDDIAEGCLEKLDGYFLKYIWNFRKNARPIVLKLLAEHPEAQVVTLQSPNETKQFERQLTDFFSQ